MNRRDFMKLIATGTAAAAAGLPQAAIAKEIVNSTMSIEDQIYAEFGDPSKLPNPNLPMPEDVWASPLDTVNLMNVYDSFFRARKTVWDRAFYTHGIEDTIKTTSSRQNSDAKIKGIKLPNRKLDIAENKFLRYLFDFDAKEYGFFGDKVITDFAEEVDMKQLKRHPMGQWLTEDADKKYKQIIEEVGAHKKTHPLSVRVTSGFRGLSYQMTLFTEKAIMLTRDPTLSTSNQYIRVANFATGQIELRDKQDLLEEQKTAQDGLKEAIKYARHHTKRFGKQDVQCDHEGQQLYMANLSAASRSRAPPGYSYHGANHFDIGTRAQDVYNLGGKTKKLSSFNFDPEFIMTPLFQKMWETGVISVDNIVYTAHSGLGVRFEPWHINPNPSEQAPMPENKLYMPSDEIGGNCDPVIDNYCPDENPEAIPEDNLPHSQLEALTELRQNGTTTRNYYAKPTTIQEKAMQKAREYQPNIALKQKPAADIIEYNGNSLRGKVTPPANF